MELGHFTQLKDTDKSFFIGMFQQIYDPCEKTTSSFCILTYEGRGIPTT